MLNKIEELSKIEILLLLFEAKIDEKLDDISYRRLMIMVDRTMYSDLMYMKENIIDGYFKIDRDEEEALLSNGFILFFCLGWGTTTEERRNLYKYTNMAKQLCKIVFGITDIPKGSNEGVLLVSETE